MTRILTAASTAIALAVGAAAFSPAGAQTVVPPAGTTARTVWCAAHRDRCSDARDIRRDTHEIRSDKRDVVSDRHELRRDVRQRDSSDVRSDRRDLARPGARSS